MFLLCTGYDERATFHGSVFARKGTTASERVHVTVLTKFRSVIPSNLRRTRMGPAVGKALR